MSELQKIQHKTRVGGPGTGEIILVNGNKYELDAEGCVSVPAAAAKKLLAGEQWRVAGGWGAARRAAADTVPESQNGARPVRTPAQLAALAAASGDVPDAGIPTAPAPADVPPAPVDDVPPAPADVPPADAPSAPADAPPAQEEEIEVSSDMSKNELLAIAEKVGLQLPPSATKAQILTALESASV